jgi:hypothetical protein
MENIRENLPSHKSLAVLTVTGSFKKKEFYGKRNRDLRFNYSCEKKNQHFTTTHSFKTGK